MLPANLTNALQTLYGSGKPAVSATPEAPKPVNKIEPGQQMLGTVQSKISEGLFKVQVAGQVIQMRLPGNIQAGSTVKLEVITTQPRITFGMIASTNPLSTPEQIGATARLLSNLADQPLERPSVQQVARNAVWQATAQAPDSKLLAGALRMALGNSGLFYESHQAQWVRGERSTAQLLVEPQNQLTGRQTVLPNPAELQNQPAGKQSTAATTTNQAKSFDELPSQPQPANVQARASDSGSPIARELMPLVQQQLHALETHQLTWIGQVWPGQEMQWEIQGEPEHQSRQQNERQWSTEMELGLPKLGDVHARLVFSERGLQLTLQAANSATVDLFNRSLPELKQSLDDAGILLIATTVEKS